MDYLRDIQMKLMGYRFRNADELVSALIEIPWFRNEVRDVLDIATLGKLAREKEKK